MLTRARRKVVIARNGCGGKRLTKALDLEIFFKKSYFEDFLTLTFKTF